MDAEQDMNFWRLVNKEFDQPTEHAMTIRAALEFALGDEAKLYTQGVIDFRERKVSAPDAKVCSCGHAKREHVMKITAYSRAGCIRCNCTAGGE
jgi:hypothetical protein